MAITKTTLMQKMKSNRWAVAVLAAAVILIIGTGAFWAYALMNNPQTKLLNAVQQLSQQEGLAADFIINSDRSYNGDFTFQRDGDTREYYRLNGNVEEDGGERITASLRNIDDMLYLKLEGLENVSSFSTDATNIQQNPSEQRLLQTIDGAWISAASEDVANLFGQSAALGFGNVSDEDTEAVINAYEAHPFFNIETKGSEDIQGLDTNRMTLRYDKEEYAAFLQQLRDSNLETISITDEQIKNARQSDEAENAVIEVWIAKGSDEFKRIKIYEENNASEFGQLTFKPANPDNVNITAPENARSLEQVFQSFLQNEARANNSANSSAAQIE